MQQIALFVAQDCIASFASHVISACQLRRCLPAQQLHAVHCQQHPFPTQQQLVLKLAGTACSVKHLCSGSMRSAPSHRFTVAVNWNQEQLGPAVSQAKQLRGVCLLYFSRIY
jgi:hypothetical protein